MEKSLESDNATIDIDKREGTAENFQDDNRVIINNNENITNAPVNNLNLGSRGGSSVESEVSSEEATPSSNTEDSHDVLQENIEKQNNLVNASEAVPGTNPADDEVNIFKKMNLTFENLYKLQGVPEKSHIYWYYNK